MVFKAWSNIWKPCSAVVIRFNYIEEATSIESGLYFRNLSARPSSWQVPRFRNKYKIQLQHDAWNHILRFICHSVQLLFQFIIHGCEHNSTLEIRMSCHVSHSRWWLHATFNLYTLYIMIRCVVDDSVVYFTINCFYKIIKMDWIHDHRLGEHTFAWINQEMTLNE